jgi:aromatic-L-amino-acid decarboxylase
MQLRHQNSLPASALFPPRSEREEIDDLLTRRLSDADARIRKGSVTPTVDMEAFRRELAAFDFREPGDLAQSLSWVIAQMEQGVVHLTHPRYFGLFNPAPTFPAQCADRIAAVFNPQLATWTTSPVAVEIEAHVIEAVLARMGFPEDAAGHFTTGGSEANFTALICALTHADPQFATDGARAFKGGPVFYVSRECHIAWIKIALQAGIGRSAVRLIATDGKGQMDPAALTATIRSDLEQGCVPVMLVATAGTTNAGMIDPLIACADIAREFRLFYHVDAAWGGALIASDGLRSALAGIELADSVTIDAHKWFATTMGCGMFFTRYADLLSSAFQTTASYMPSNIASVDPYVTTAQWSRRFLGLRLFLSLASAGWRGYGKHVEHCVQLSELLREQLLERGWLVANASPVAVLCVAPPPGLGEVEAIVKQIVKSGIAWVSVAVFEGRRYVRICVTHGEATAEDITTLIDSLHP